MKFQTYTEQVPLGTQAPKSGYGAMTKPSNAGANEAVLANSIGKVTQFVEKQNEEDDKLTLMQAMNDLDKQRSNLLNNDQDGLLTKQMDGAAGISEDYQRSMEKATADISSKAKFKTREYKLAFQNLAMKANQQGYDKVSKYEYQQKERAGDVAYAENMENKQALMQKNYRNPAEIDNVIQDIALVTAMRYPASKIGAKALELKTKQEIGKAVGAGIVQALTDDDVASAQTLYEDYDRFLTPDQRNKLGSIIKQRSTAKQTTSTIDAYYKKYGGDINAIKSALEGATEAGPIGDKESFFHAVAMQESGGDYTEVNGRTGAFGKYQIMPDNWPSWSKEAGLPEGADINDPANQERVARYKLGQYYDKYGAEGALVAWYAGEANAKRWVDGAPDAIGEGGHYSWDAKQGKGDEPSVREYVKQALGRGANVPMSEEMKQKILNGCMQKKAQEERLQNYQDKQLVDSCWNEFYADALNGVPYEQVEAKINRMAAGDGRKFDKLQRIASSFYKTGGNGSNGASSGKALSEPEKQALAQVMYSGEFTDYQDGLEYVITKWPGNLKAIAEYKKLYDQKQEGKGIFGYNMDGVVDAATDGLIKKNDPAGQEIKRAAKIAAVAFVNKFRDENNGKDPSYWDVVAEVRKGIPKVKYGTYPKEGMFSWTGETNLELSPNSLRDAGIDTFYRLDNSSMFSVKFLDGHVEAMSGEAIKKRVEGAN